MASLLTASGAALLPVPAQAQGITLVPLLDLRLRHETVGQEGMGGDARALMLRVRPGAEASTGPWRLLAEAESTAPLIERYDSGLNDRTDYPLIADPENFELNRLQIQYRGIARTLATAGRQRINLDDQRFVGASGWRNNEQTFDAVRMEYAIPKGLRVDLTYSWAVRTIWGEDGRDARQEAVRGDNVFVTIGHPTPLGAVTGFAIFVDQEEPVVSLYRQSSRTVGARLSGGRRLFPMAKLTYVLSYARQRDHARNPNDYEADYQLAEAGLDVGAARLGVGREVLGADDGRPFTSLQTPLATLHKFQGWADKFLVTPPNGVRDLYGSASYSWKRVAGFDAVNANIIYHRFRGDHGGAHYGNEWNASLSAKKGRWTVTGKLADYDADTFATDTRKAWLQLEWAY